MPRDARELSVEERQAIGRVLSQWAELHPRPDIPIIQLLDGSELTPQSLADAVRDPGSIRGQLIYRVFSTGLVDDGVEQPEKLDEILADFQHDIEAWRG